MQLLVPVACNNVEQSLTRGDRQKPAGGSSRETEIWKYERRSRSGSTLLSLSIIRKLLKPLSEPSIFMTGGKLELPYKYQAELTCRLYMTYDVFTHCFRTEAWLQMCPDKRISSSWWWRPSSCCSRSRSRRPGPEDRPSSDNRERRLDCFLWRDNTDIRRRGIGNIAVMMFTRPCYVSIIIIPIPLILKIIKELSLQVGRLLS